MRSRLWLGLSMLLVASLGCEGVARPDCPQNGCTRCCSAEGQCVDCGSPRDGGREAAPDAGTFDAGDEDAGGVDGGQIDAGTVDAGQADSGLVDAGSVDGSSTDAGASDAASPTWLIETGITSDQLGILINTKDPLSVQIGERYAQARQIPPDHIVRLQMSSRAVLPAAEFAPLKLQADAVGLDAGIQAWVITWTWPYRVDCMSVTTAFAAGFDKAFCAPPCNTTKALPTYDDEGQPDAGRSAHRPFDSFGIRPTMMLATGLDASTALELIDRGVAADDTDPTGDLYFVRTTDSARSVRYSDFLGTTLPEWNDGGLTVRYLDAVLDAGPQFLANTQNVLFYFQGLAVVPSITTNTYLPGAITDHLTSNGGSVPDSPQMSVLRWLEAGSTASYGTVVEPCNFRTKFPNTTPLVSHYYRGEPLIEAYWKSVSMPGEGLFVGEPLATPWKPHSSWDPSTRTLTLSTTMLQPQVRYLLQSAPAREGPWTVVRPVKALRHDRVRLVVQDARAPFYRLVRE